MATYVPVDQSTFTLKGLSVAAAAFNGEQQKSKDGTPQWEIQCLHEPTETASGWRPDSQVIKVTLTAAQAPRVTPMQVMRFEGLRYSARIKHPQAGANRPAELVERFYADAVAGRAG